MCNNNNNNGNNNNNNSDDVILRRLSLNKFRKYFEIYLPNFYPEIFSLSAAVFFITFS